uniref:Peptidase M48 domain-containing protein n=1 Tax=mine drainage metagenome TaxID=410659 RepID=E6Q2B5_9ZZZZ
MSLTSRIVRIVASCFLLALIFAPHALCAREFRPDALDRQLNALSEHRLLATPIRHLLDPERSAAAHRLLRWRLPLWIVVTGAEFFALLYLWSSGNAARLRDALRRGMRGDAAAEFAMGASLAAVVRVAALIPNYARYRLDRALGRSEVLGAEWLWIWLLGTVTAMLVGGALLAIVFRLLARTKRWYLPTAAILAIAAFVGGMLYPVVVVPVLWPHHERSVQLTKENRTLAASFGLHDIPIRVAQADYAGLADRVIVVGIFTTREILASLSVERAYSIRERAFLLARVDAMLASRVPIRRTGIDLALVLLGVAIAVVLSERLGVRRDDDPLSRVALLAALLVLAYAAIAPVDLAMRRSAVFAADRAAVAMTHDPAAAVRALVRQGDHRVEGLCPSAAALIFVDPHPPLGARIAAIEGRADPCREPSPFF